MVPFAEVVLLTAMEYHRKDAEQNGMMEINAESQGEDGSEEKGSKRCWIPKLKTLGDIF